MVTADSESSEVPLYFSIISTSVKTEIKIKNSRFITFALPVKNKEECQSIITKYKKRYHDASHVCFAYRLGVGMNNSFITAMPVNRPGQRERQFIK